MNIDLKALGLDDDDLLDLDLPVPGQIKPPMNAFKAP